MKKFFVLLGLMFFTVVNLILPVQSIEAEERELTTADVVTYSQDSQWGLKDKNDNVIVPAQYRKLIRLGNHAWIAQNKRYKYGLIDTNGNILVPIKYRHADRLVSKFAKFGNDHDYGVYDEWGNTIVKPEYSKIDILFGQMFLTYKNYKYGIVGYDGKEILENKFDDIYMPKPNVMRIEYEGKWYELEQVKADTLTLPADAQNTLSTKEDLNLQNIVVNTGVISGYSVVTFSDYLIKLFSSISPAHEQTIDELMLSQGAETVSIFVKLSWLPKYPVTYVKKYIENLRNPNNGPLSGVRKELKRQIK